MSKQSRNWCWTINNWTPEQYASVLEFFQKKVKYGVVGKEVGKETHTPHLQCYAQFKGGVDFSMLKRAFPTAHIEACKGTPEQNVLYCKKEGDFEEFGEMKAQGKRTDLQQVTELVQKNTPMREIIPQVTSFQAVRGAEMIYKYFEQKRDWKPHVTWIFGDSGTGKTRMAYEILGKDCYRKTNSSGFWWDGYDAHEAVLLDDLKDTTQAFYSVLLELTDRYPCRVQYKGGSREFLAKRIVITSISCPEYLYQHHHGAKEILRRIDEIKELGGLTEDAEHPGG